MASDQLHHHRHEHGPAEKAKDPVCGMNVNREQPRGGHCEYHGETYYFCNPKCRERFSADPEKYLHPEPKASEPAPAALAPSAPARVYVCPMDPEVREPKPGACPKCGMALEPE